MKFIVAVLASLMLACMASPALAADNLVTNFSVELGGTEGADGWIAGGWGLNDCADTVTTPPAVPPFAPASTCFAWMNEGHTGTHSLKVEVNSYTSGDVSISPRPFAVTGGSFYKLTDWYKSNRATGFGFYWDTKADGLIDNTGGAHWSSAFAGIPPSETWKQASAGIILPDEAQEAMFYHYLPGAGTLQTDDYSMEVAAPSELKNAAVSLTFDDGSTSFLDLGKPVVDQYGFKTTQYIPTQYLGIRPMMTTTEIGDLSRAGHEIGAHTVTHPFLTRCTPTCGTNAYLAEQLEGGNAFGTSRTQELTQSKAALEAIPGVGPVTDFAYPFGDYDDKVMTALQAAGYTMARSVEAGYNSKLDLEPYDIRVQNMRDTTTEAEFESWVNFAKEHHLWLSIVYHEIVLDSAPVCSTTSGSPCLGAFDVTASKFRAQMAFLKSSGVAVKTMKDAYNIADNETHGPVASAQASVTITPTKPHKTDTLTATPETKEFGDPDGDTLTFSYQWMIDGTSVATGQTFDLTGHAKPGDIVSVNVRAHDPQNHFSDGVSDSVTVEPGPTPPPTPQPEPKPPVVVTPPSGGPPIGQPPVVTPPTPKAQSLALTNVKLSSKTLKKSVKLSFAVNRPVSLQWKLVRNGKTRAKSVRNGKTRAKSVRNGKTRAKSVLYSLRAGTYTKTIKRGKLPRGSYKLVLTAALSPEKVTKTLSIKIR